jgi:hypothetical protein
MSINLEKSAPSGSRKANGEGKPSPSVSRGGAAHQHLGSTFTEVWSQVTSDPYVVLPFTKVTLRSFFRGLRYRLLEAGRRTLAAHDDLLPHFDKLIRPNGICLSGTWEIQRATHYSGLFATRAKGLVIARASVALTETKSGHRRSFGMAGKVYPTLDARERVTTANFFAIDDNGGTPTRHFQDAAMTNEPTFSVNASSLAHAPVLAAIAIAQRLSDSNTGTRQLYPLAAAGVSDPSKISSPRWLKIRGKPGPRIASEDFRDELRLAVQRQPIEMEISVRDQASSPWQVIGTIEFDQCVASESCDHCLHFAHPPWKKDPTGKDDGSRR